MPTPSSSAASIQAIAAFRQGLRELGHVEGQKLVIESHYAEGGQKQIPELAAELVRLNVDVIVSGSSDATRAVQQATKKIPIVMAVSGSPVAQGFVASLARPGGNITGLSMLAPEIAGKRLELLKEYVPKAARVAVLRWPLDPNTSFQWSEMEVVARRLGLELIVLELQGSNPDFGHAFDSAVRGKADAMIALADPRIAGHGKEIADLAIKHRLPTMFFERTLVEAGGLLSYGPSILDMFRRAAGYVDKLMKGAKPGDLPVEQPAKFDLILNLKTAHALGLTIPQSMVLRATEVIR